MDPVREFAAELLIARARELASLAASELCHRHTDIAQRFAPQPHLKWTDHLQGRLEDLAAAVQAGRPALFASQTRWSGAAFAARGVPTDDLTRSLRVLRDVVLRETPEEDRDAVRECFQAALDGPAPTPEERHIDVSTPAGRLAASYLLAVLEGDRRQASALVVEAVASGRIGVRGAYLDVLRPAQAELGRLWHAGELTVGEEHFATATTSSVMSQLYPYMQRRPSRGRTLVAGCVEGNAHDVGLRMVADFFEIDGWRVIFLGANVPANDLAVACLHFDADLLAVSATLTHHLRAVADTVRACRELPELEGLRVILGGPALRDADGLWQEIGADGCADDADAAVILGARLVGVATDTPPPARGPSPDTNGAAR